MAAPLGSRTVNVVENDRMKRRSAILRTCLRSWDNFFYSGFSGQSLGLLRCYFGWGLLLFHCTQFGSLITLSPLGAHFFFLEPIWYFDLIGIAANPPLLTFVVLIALFVATVSMALGKWTRVSIAVVIICLFYLKGVRDSFTGDVHHRYVLPTHLLFLLLLSRCGDRCSWDAQAQQAENEVHEWQASWPIRAMQVYCASFYVWSIFAKLRVSGWTWFAEGNRLQELLIKRSVRWGVTDSGEIVSNSLAFEMAHFPDLLFALSLMMLVIEAGFPILLFLKQAKWRAVFLSIVVVFHLANYVFLNVGFVLIPIVFIIFFDLVPLHAWLKARFERFRPAQAAQ